MVKSKKSNLLKANFAKVNSSRTDFLTPEAKKASTKAPILRHFDSEHHIWIETDTLGYTISGVFYQMTLDPPSSDHVINKNHFDFPKSQIG